LSSLAEALSSGRVEVIVVCNCCTDDTAAIAATFPGVQVLSLPVASKVAALNAGDDIASKWPRVYLDADVDLPSVSLRQTLERLSEPYGPLCARPTFTYDTAGATKSVEAYYRARDKMLGTRSAMWGAGIYAVNQRGHERLGSFPEIINDDLLIDRLFIGHEKQIVDGHPVRVRTPRNSRALLATLGRTYRGNAEQSGGATSTTVKQLVMTIRGLGSARDAAIYAAFALVGRGISFVSSGWGTDFTSRQPASSGLRSQPGVFGRR
jgi:glycosyltransferase involved in cell wall biosynthesis